MATLAETAELYWTKKTYRTGRDSLVITIDKTMQHIEKIKPGDTITLKIITVHAKANKPLQKQNL